MALIKCSECGKEISDKAKTCPHCGCPTGNTKIKEIKENAKSINKTIKSKKDKLFDEIKNDKKMKIYIFIAIVLIVLIIVVDVYSGIKKNNDFNKIYYDCKDKPTLYGIEVQDDAMLVGSYLSGRVNERTYYKENEKNYAHINNSCHDIAKERTGISNFWLKIGDAFR